MTPRRTCPACDGRDLQALYDLPAIPAQSVVLLDSAEEARAYPAGALTLTLCHGCGFLFNARFDARLVDYARTTEESQHFSGTFNSFALSLVEEIAARQDLVSAHVLEIGCGKGDFLEALVQRTGCSACGIDPGFLPVRKPGVPIRFVRADFRPELVDRSVDLIVCRHTLEHIAEVAAFMRDVVAVTRGAGAVQIVFETPDTARILREGAFWDIYHEHCSYFTVGSHARLFRRAGLDVTQSALVYDGQYIIQYAEPGAGSPRPEEQDLEETVAAALAFPEKVAQTRAYWTDHVRAAHARGERTAIWGGGSKAVAFLTTNGLGPEIDHVIDVNPYKQGKFLPGTGHRVSAPDALRDAPPDRVIVMNPIYVPEITEALAAMGLHPDITAL